MASTEVGHHEARVYLSQDGKLVVPSSAKLQVEYGGLFAPYPASSGVIQVTTSKTGTITNRGVTIIKTSEIGVLALAQPTKTVLGTVKTIIWETSAGVKVRTASAAAGSDIKLSSSGSVISITAGGGKSFHKTVDLGATVQLLAQSTARWRILSMHPSMTTGTVVWTISSTT